MIEFKIKVVRKPHVKKITNIFAFRLKATLKTVCQQTRMTILFEIGATKKIRKKNCSTVKSTTFLKILRIIIANLIPT